MPVVDRRRLKPAAHPVLLRYETKRQIWAMSAKNVRRFENDAYQISPSSGQLTRALYAIRVL